MTAVGLRATVPPTTITSPVTTALESRIRVAVDHEQRALHAARHHHDRRCARRRRRANSLPWGRRE